MDVGHYLGIVMAVRDLSAYGGRVRYVDLGIQMIQRANHLEAHPVETGDRAGAVLQECPTLFAETRVVSVEGGSAGEVGVAWEPVALEAVSPWGRSRPLAVRPPGVETAPGDISTDGRSVRYVDGWTLDGLSDGWRSGMGRVEYTMRLQRRPEVGLISPHSLDLRVNLSLRPGTSLQSAGKPVELPLETNRPLEFVGPDGEALLLIADSIQPTRNAPAAMKISSFGSSTNIAT